MGACLSCLGLQRSSDDEPSETDRLLYDETTANRTGYGTAGQGAQVSAPDPEELRRHREMLERICAETANNLIDVETTNAMALHGKPSAEFTKLLNTHFATSSANGSTDQEPPKTPVHNTASTPPEPPSPFTQAQLHAAAQNGRTSAAMTTSTFATISEHADSDAPTTRETSRDRGREGAHTSAGAEDDMLDPEEAAEEAWLASLGVKDTSRWDDIKQPSDSLVVALGADENDGPKPK
ncbi:hypothetical protein K461DRAFT_309692 [Myriangium duriaei CBS 260.36]|uniref:Uncharacterized protein n=1 Tax=Myriangium duriaei CBS 260.36 TaxID=1168546 RepID=A0A9P4J9T8_9PEZI|nr:hypothetical protein K461DRAFT_309692 [Myriangium duriaei CBS 260.36]